MHRILPAAALPTLLLALLLAAGCASSGPATIAPPPEESAETAAGGDAPEPSEPDAEPAEAEPVVVGELWETGRRPEEGLEAVAVWPGAGDRAWLITTARATHRLVVFDAATGELLREMGVAGDGPAQFQDPGAVTVVDDLVLVAESGNDRVQVLRLPGLAPLGFVPLGGWGPVSGLAAARRPGGGYELLVTSSGAAAGDAAAGAGSPARGGGEDAARRYLLDLRDGQLESSLFEAAGSRAGDAAEPAGNAAAPAGAADLRSPSMGAAAGSLGAAYACADGGDYLVLAEGGSDPTLFRLLDRATGEPVATFTGRRTANTSGLWLSQVPLPELPAGALYAVHDGESVTVFDWRDVAAATGAREDCVREGK